MLVHKTVFISYFYFLFCDSDICDTYFINSYLGNKYLEFGQKANKTL